MLLLKCYEFNKLARTNTEDMHSCILTEDHLYPATSNSEETKSEWSCGYQ